MSNEPDAIINYGTDRWKPDFWYTTPIHGECFDEEQEGLQCKSCGQYAGIDIPTSWSIQMLDPNGMEGDMYCLDFDEMGYMTAREICNAHNKVVWNIDRNFDPELRGKEFVIGNEYASS